LKLEIEHKFLVVREAWDTVEKPEGIPVRQGYLTDDPGRTIRVRVMGNHGFLTIKGPSGDASRAEYEYFIPVEEAEELLEHFAIKKIEKTRYKVVFAGKLWEVDEFLGENAGLLMAEIELSDVSESYEKPAWAGEEVTSDPRYYNAYLASNPYKFW
jgi:adenylate cyclase